MLQGYIYTWLVRCPRSLGASIPLEEDLQSKLNLHAEHMENWKPLHHFSSGAADYGKYGLVHFVFSMYCEDISPENRDVLLELKKLKAASSQ
eukprot:4678975-Amphidinium_carterae.1